MPGQTTPLSDMLKDASRRGQSYDTLAARAVDPATGATISSSQLHNIALGKAERMPPDGQLAAIAAALGLDYEIIRRAAFLQYAPPRNEHLRAVEEQTLAHMLIDGVDAVAEIVARAYRRKDDERAAAATADVDATVEEADSEVPRLGSRRKSA